MLLNVDPVRIDTAKRYLAYSLLGHLAWEVLQLPLYTIFRTASAAQNVFAVLHCTGGDILIAAITLGIGYVMASKGVWPDGRRVYLRVASVTVASGLLYTALSEWFNTTVLHAWAYTPAMPVIPPYGIGVAPLAQWIIVPSVAFLFAARRMRSEASDGTA
jgi:hypothetical protein